MATAVQIELRVDEQGALQGIRSFDTSIKGSTASVRQLNTELGAAGAKARVAGAQAAQAVNKVGVESLNTLERTRLVTEEFGIRLPRAMVRLIAQSEIAQKAISAVGTGIIALGAAQVGVMIFSQLAEGVKKLWDNYLSLNSAQKAYQEELEKTKQEDYWRSDSIETTTMRIREATAAAREYRSYAEGANKAGWGLIGASLASGDLQGAAVGIGLLAAGHKSAGESVKNQQSVDKLTPEQAAQQHELNNLTIEEAHAGDAALRVDQRRNAEKQKRIQLAAEERRYDTAKNRALGNPVDSAAGAAKEKLQIRIAQREADAEAVNQRRELNAQIIHMQDEARQSELHGIALLEDQRKSADAAWIREHGASADAIKAIDDKFYAEEKKQLENQRRETEKIERSASVTGLTGVSKIRAEGANRGADIRDADFEDVDAHGHSVLAERQRAAAKKQTDAEIVEAEQQFTDRVNTLAEESASHQISGFARIRAEGQKQIEALEKDYQKLYGSDVTAPEYQRHLGELNQGVGAINAGTSQDAAELAHRNAEETLQIEMEARARSMSAEKQQTQAIIAEYEQRLEKYQDELSQQNISQDDYNRRVLAAAQLRDAEMEESAKQSREKMAGEFSRFFSNPVQAAKEFGDKAAGEAAAALMQRMQGRVAGGGSTRESLGTPGTGDWLSGIFGHIAGAPRPGGAHSIEAATRMNPTGLLSIGAAQIRVGSASIALGGGTGGGFTPGSTSLFGGPRLSSAVYSSGGGTAGGFGFGGETAGGAGDMGFGGANTLSFGAPAGSSGSMPAGPGVASQVMSGANQGMSLFKQAKGLFSSGSGGDGSDAGAGLAETQSADLSGSINKAGSFNLGKSGSTLFNGGGMGAAAGAAGGAMGMFSAFEGNGGLGGALQGGMAGFQLGMSVGGPIGAAIGAAGGAIIGAIGFGGREKARVYDLKTVRPRIEQDTDSYQQGTMDYLSAYADLQSTDVEAHNTLRKMGGAAHKYYWDTIIGEIHQAEGKLNAEQRAGRSNYTAQAAQYDVGADMLRQTGWAVVHKGERITPSDQNERITRALEAGASSESIARGYRAAMGASSAKQWGANGDRTVNMNFHTLDSKTAARMFMENKHHVRAALNASYAENSGGADA